MAKALQGKFFWEHTSRTDPDLCAASVAIRNGQKRFVEKAAYFLPMDWRARPAPSGTKEKVEEFLDAVAASFRVSKDDIKSRTTRKTASVAKSFFMWGLCRYFPHISILALSRIVDRNHATVIHGRDQFKQVEHLYADLVSQMDKFMAGLTQWRE